MQLDVNGTRLWFDVDGQALVPDGSTMRGRPTVVFLHGGPGSFDHSYFKPDFGRLAETAQVVYLDLRGHGRSEWGGPAAWTFEDCADDVRGLCDALGVERPVVLGHSLGGFVAMVYAVRHPGHAAALVLQSTFARFDLSGIVEAFRVAGGDEVAAVAERFYGGGRSSVSAEEWVRCFRLFGPWVPGAEERARTVVDAELNAPGLELMRGFDVVEQLAAVDCPTLVCVGERDPIAPVAAAREIADALPAGNARARGDRGGGPLHVAGQARPLLASPRRVRGRGGLALGDRRLGRRGLVGRPRAQERPRRRRCEHGEERGEDEGDVVAAVEGGEPRASRSTSMLLLGLGAGVALNPGLLAAMSDVPAGGGGPRLARRQHVPDRRKEPEREFGLRRFRCCRSSGRV